jgi:tetraacyldisaccharide 4'-kinase
VQRSRLAAQLQPDAAFLAALGGGRVLAFAGIGDPEKFFATLADAGVDVAARRSFPDHHRYTRADAQSLCAHADREGLVLVTTEKDLARLAGDGEAAELAAHAHALPVILVFEKAAEFQALLLERIAAARAAS